MDTIQRAGKFSRLLTSLLLALVLLQMPASQLTGQAAEGAGVAEEAALSGSWQAKTLSTGARHGCAIRSDGTLACWGDNSDGQAAPPAGRFIQVGSGYAHTCGLKGDGTLACWGLALNGRTTPPAGTFTQLSVGGGHACAINLDSTVACWGWNTWSQASPPFETFTQISAGFAHTCGIRTDGTLACWGYNPSGQSSPPSGVFIQVAAGTDHTCAIRSDGTLACWGAYYSGQNAPPAGTFTRLSAGNAHNCAVKSDGTVACWGRGDEGQSTPPAGTFTQVSAADLNSCGLKSDGTLVCWGDNTFNRSTPPGGSFGRLQISAGNNHACVIKDDGTLACWGYNAYGETNAPAGTFTQVSAGGLHTCGIRSDGTLACWGLNENNRATPPAGIFTQVAAGSEHTCALRSDGMPVCWGDNAYGQSSPPAGTFVQISTRADHTCGMRSDGVLLCWGWNGKGQTTVPEGSYTQVSAGALHTCAVKTDGTVDCWGLNVEGTEPAGTFIQVSAGLNFSCGIRSDRTQACWGSYGSNTIIPPAGTFTQISSDCGIRTDGSLSCWSRTSPGIQISPTWLPTGSEGAAYAQNLTASGGTAPYTFSLAEGSLPPGLSLSVDGAISGTVSARGTYSFTVQVLDSSFPFFDSQQYTVIIFNANPSASSQTTSTQEDKPVNITLEASDAGPFPLTWLVGSPGHGVLTGTAPNLIYIPAKDWNGTDSFTFKVNDGMSDSATATVTITVAPENDAPVASGQSIETAEDVSKSIHLNAADVEGDALIWTVGAPGHGSLTGTAPDLTYQPNGDWNGTDSFTFYVFDGAANSNQSTVTVTVTPVNDTPVADSKTVETQEDHSLAVTLAAHDADGDSLSWSLTAPAHGDLTGKAPNLSYTPNQDWSGTDTFTFNALDGKSISNLATVTIIVKPVNDAPVAVPLEDAEWLAGEEHGIILPAYSDVDSNNLTYTLTWVGHTGLPSWLSFDGATRTLIGMPQFMHAGDYVFTLTGSDGELSASSSFTLHVVGVYYEVFLPALIKN